MVAVARVAESEVFAEVGPFFVFDPFTLGLAAFIIGMAVVKTTIHTRVKIAPAKIAGIPEPDAVRHLDLSVTIRTNFHAFLDYVSGEMENLLVHG